MGRTPERESLFDFTFSYMTLHGAIVVRKDNEGIRSLGDLRGRQVAVMKGDNAEEFLRREDRGIQFRTTTTFEGAFRLLSKGECDAVVVQRLVALRLLQETGISNLRVLERPVEGFRQDFCFGVREGDRDTLALLNEAFPLLWRTAPYDNFTPNGLRPSSFRLTGPSSSAAIMISRLSNTWTNMDGPAGSRWI